MNLNLNFELHELELLFQVALGMIENPYDLVSFSSIGIFRSNYFRSSFERFGTTTLNLAFLRSHKKWKDSLESNLDRILFVAKLKFPKILVPRIPHNSSNVNIECAGKSKQMHSIYSLCDEFLGAIIYLHFIILILICF